MQKALTFMNIQLHHVITDVTGVTGMNIIRAIVSGERDPEVMAEMRDVRCKTDHQTMCAALIGNYQKEHLFALQQALELYDFYQLRVHQCDAQIEASLKGLCISESTPSAPLPKPRHKTKQPNQLSFDSRAAIYQLVGTDLTQIHGIEPYLALKLVAECGTDLSRWKTSKHFTSWLTLCPGNKISGGKVLSSHSRKTNNRLTAHLRLAAVTVGRTNIDAMSYPVSRSKARRLMKEAGVLVKRRKKFKVTTDSNHAKPLFDNVLDRDFASDVPDQAYVQDITYI